jgi:hypothetical protein
MIIVLTIVIIIIYIFLLSITIFVLYKINKFLFDIINEINILKKDIVKIKVSHNVINKLKEENNNINNIESKFNVKIDMLKNDINDFKDITKSTISYINNIIDEKQSIYKNKFDILINNINNYFDFFLKLKYNRKIFNSLFYLSKKEIDIILNYYINNDNKCIYKKILSKYFNKYFDKEYNDYFPLPIKIINNINNIEEQSEFKNYYCIENNNISSLVKSIENETINFISFHNINNEIYDYVFLIEKTKLLNETNKDFELKILQRIELYFDNLYLIYQKYKYFGIIFN